MARPFIAIAAALVMASFAADSANGQSTLTERLLTDRLAIIQSGSYQAGERVNFTLDHAGENFLLRFDGEPEVFVLYAGHASLGGRVLKYDSGETALQVTGWGGITLYTDNKPGGLPAMRIADSVPPVLPDVSLDELRSAVTDETAHLSYTRRLNVAFTTDWNALAENAGLRALSFDALQNAARGIDSFAETATGHRAIETRIDTVLLSASGNPTLRLQGRQMTVTFDPSKGYAGRASSRAIAHALRRLFHVRS